MQNRLNQVYITRKMLNLNVNEKLDLVNNIELFRGLSREELMLIAVESNEKVYETGELLFRENMPRKQIFLIADGKVELFKTSPFGEAKSV